MKCKDSRKINYLTEYPHVVTEDMLEAKRHVNECRECAEFFEGEKLFSSMLKGAVKKEFVPLDLKNKILCIETQRKGYLKKINKIFAVAAALVVLVAGGYLVSVRTKSPSVLDKIVADHAKFLPSPQAQINTVDADRIKAWFRGRVDFPVTPPSINATLRGGRLCVLDKKHFALLFYEHSGSPVSVFITDGTIPDDLKTKKEVMIQDKKAYVLHKSGYTILLWEDMGLMYSLVSELDVEQIQKIF